MLAGPVFAAPMGAVLGPLRVADRWAVLRVGPRRLPQPLPYEAVRADVLRALRAERFPDALGAHLDGLRAEHPVTVADDALARARLFAPSGDAPAPADTPRP